METLVPDTEAESRLHVTAKVDGHGLAGLIWEMLLRIGGTVLGIRYSQFPSDLGSAAALPDLFTFHALGMVASWKCATTGCYT